MIKNNISQLLETELERKDFLKLLGFGFIAALGVTQVLKALTQQTSTQPKSHGYGGLPYGGITRK